MVLLRELEACLKNQRVYRHLNAFITLPADDIALRKLAQDAEGRRRTGSPLSSIDGRAIAIKDNICTSQLPTTCASKILKGFTSPFNGTVVHRLEAAGALIVGKTNLDEFGMGSHSTNSHFNEVRNPSSNEASGALSAGGSSGGSAVAVATGQCYAALGTDTGGSVRLPAAYNGVFGFKPSYGLISRWGVVAYANSLDTVGVLARTTDAASKMYTTLNNHDPQDPTSMSNTTRKRIRELVSSVERTHWRIGVPMEYNIEEMDPVVRQTWMKTLHFLESQGHTIVPVNLPTTKHALSAYYVLAPAEASSNLAKFDGIRYGQREGHNDASGGVVFATTRGNGFGHEVKRRILLGAYSLSAAAIDNHFIQAQKIRRQVQSEFDKVFSLANQLLAKSVDDLDSTDSREGVDILVCPTAPTLPPTLKSVKEQSPLESYMNDFHTIPASLAGLPAMSVPVCSDGENEPLKEGQNTVGIQVIAQYGDDELVLKVSQLIEEWTSSQANT